MYSKLLILHFPRTIVDKPIVCNLVKDFDLSFNILRATIFPRREGKLVLELTGDSRQSFNKGLKYLKESGVRVEQAGQEIKRDEETCTHCGTCTSVCPTGALYIKRPEMEVIFEAQKCSACELCINVCPPRAMKAKPNHEAAA